MPYSFPRAAFRVVIGEQRLQTIQRRREPRFRAFLGLEFLPESTHLLRLIWRQHPENPVGCLLLAFAFTDLRLCVVDKNITRINFHEIVDQNHLEDAKRIDRHVRVFGEEHGHQCKMVHVFGIIFAARRIGDHPVAPENGLDLVGLDQKGELPLQPLRVGRRRTGG